MLQVKIVILSLPSSERRYIIEKRLNECNISNYIFFDAFDARYKDLSELDDIFDINKFTSIYGRNPARGEIGCTLSHLNIWNMISVSDTENWIILEDDAIFQKKFYDFYNHNCFPDYLTILGNSKKTLISSIISDITTRLFNKIKMDNYSYGQTYKRNWCGTVGYFLPRKRAIELINNIPNKPWHLADDWHFLNQITPIYHSSPMLILEDFKNMHSSILLERSALKVGSRK